MDEYSKIDIITTSVEGWDEYVKPLVDSLEKYQEKTSNIIVVDAGGNYPDNYKDVKIIHTPILNCSEAQNVGIRASSADWFLILDCDVLCTGYFTEWIQMLEQDAIYGNVSHMNTHKLFTGPNQWLDGWIYAIPRVVFSAVGYFDENFKGSGFEDADYCWRVYKAGYDVRLADLPFKHLAAGQKRNITSNYSKTRLQNVEYLKKKWKL